MLVETMSHARPPLKMNGSHWTLLSAFVLVLAPADAQKISPPADANGEVSKIFARFNHTDSPGCAIGASINGATVLSAAYGMADLEHNIALSPDSVFEPGSVTKQFTAAALLLLVQDGKLSLDDPVRKYIPELPDYGTTITIRHLINHTSGLRDWGSVASIAGWPRTTRANSNVNVLEIASRQKALNYTPGAEYSYTNTGFNLSAILVGRVSGKSLAEFTKERIFMPLGMTSTEWRDDFQRIVHNRAIAYTQTGGVTRQEMPFENAHGNGGLLTTVSDLLRWNRNFTEMKVGGQTFVHAQHEQGRLNDGRTIAYAAGLMVLTHKGLHEVSHSGSTAGYRGWLGRYPDQGLSVALLCNTAAANPTQLGHAVADLYLASVIQHPAEPSVQIDVAGLQAKAGLYRSVRDHTVLSVDVKDGHLELDRRGALKPVSAKSFQASGEESPLVEFDTDAAGKARMRLLTEGDEGNYYEKVERVNPSRSELESMTGDYVSDEAEVTLTVSLEQNGLVIHRRPDAKMPLTPTYRDGFSSSLGSVRFIRDAGGHVTEMSIGEQRVWDLRLRRVPQMNSSSR
jgi:CubicO group peptidase (beta-lactamase class C family)